MGTPRRSRASRADKGVTLSGQTSGRQDSRFVAGACMAVVIFCGGLALKMAFDTVAPAPGVRALTPWTAMIPAGIAVLCLYLRYLVVSQGRARTKRSLPFAFRTRRELQTAGASEQEAHAQPRDVPRTAPTGQDAPVVQVVGAARSKP